MKILVPTCTLSLLFFSLLIGCKKDTLPNKAPTANAGADRTITLPQDTVTLVGFGTDEDGKIVGYTWEQVSGPNSAVMTTPANPSSLLNGLIEGSYTFKLSVYDNNGATASDEIVIIVNAPVIVTSELQPSQNPNEIHILGNNSGFDESDPNSPEICAAEWTTGGIEISIRAAFAFDLSNIPSDATISNAKLSLYSNPTPLNGNQIDPNYGANNSFLIQQITMPWTASTAKWLNQPSATTTNQVLIPSAPQGLLDLPDIDVTAIVADMVKNNTNYGFLIRLQNEVVYTSRVFCSSRYPDATKHPKLVVTYAKHS